MTDILKFKRTKS